MLRLGVVLGRGGGALAPMALPFRVFLGGPVGSGRQWVSWVHLDDVVGIVLRALDRESLRGAVNVVAPTPVRQQQLALALAAALGRPSWLRVPGPVLKLAVGGFADQLLRGRRIEPRKLNEDGYAFRYPAIEAALRASL